MTWREERRLLNQCLAKHNLISKRGQRVVGQSARAARNRKRVRAVQKWRRTHKKEYRKQLNQAKTAYASRQQTLQRARLTKRRAQHAVIEAFFLCQKLP